MIYQPPLRGNTAFFLSVTESAEFPYHWHKEVEILYCITGAVNLVVEGKNHTLTAGQMMLVNSTEEHSVSRAGGAPRLLVIEGGDALLGERFDHLTSHFFTEQVLDLRNGTPAVPAEGTRRIAAALDALLAEKERGAVCPPDQYWFLMGYCCELFAALCRYVPMQAVESEKTLKKIKYFDIVQPVISYIEEHFDREITIEDAANLANYERTSFCRLFRTVTGVTFLHYLNCHRVEAAKRMIGENNLPVGEIGKRCGIPNAKSFARVFRQYTGSLPTEYKKALSNLPKSAPAFSPVSHFDDCCC